MYMLQLFDAAATAHPIDARLLREGMITIGRDSKCDWPIPDPDLAISRTHCEVTAASEGLLVRALGTNGVFDEATGGRLPDRLEVSVSPPCAIRLGRFRIVLTRAPLDDSARNVGSTMVLTPPLGGSLAVPTDWSDPAPLNAAVGESLLEAFCRGAGLEASLLSSEDSAEIMERAGAVYRQLVLGLVDLMEEREGARARYNLTRTTIGGSGNNPFKWAPTQRLAIDMLLSGSRGFVSGPSAISSSLQDIKRHLIATFAGLHASLRCAVDTFDPARLDAAVAERASLLKSRGALRAEEAEARHADLVCQLGGEPGSLEEAFVHAYALAEQTAKARA
jgi:predicted component of type VI protein secretion system